MICTVNQFFTSKHNRKPLGKVISIYEIMSKIVDTKFRFHLKHHIVEKVQHLVFRVFSTSIDTSYIL